MYLCLLRLRQISLAALLSILCSDSNCLFCGRYAKLDAQLWLSGIFAEGEKEEISHAHTFRHTRLLLPNKFIFMADQPNNPLHGKTLQFMLEQLLERYGWDGLAKRIDINCFKSNPSIKSSLTFLRKTAWARQKVEDLYVYSFRK